MQNQQINFLDKLSDRLKKDNRLEKLSEHFINNYKITPTFGVEIEFYLSKHTGINEFTQKLGFAIKPEKGMHQFEIDLAPSSELSKYAEYINDLKLNLQRIATTTGGNIDFSSKPFPDDYGNSMHFNLSFTEDKKLIEQAASSLCHFMQDTFLIFMPHEEDYLRLDHRFMAPTHVSYGGNNRTTAIRIPDTYPLRLEHRISSNNVDPYLVMTTILTSILFGFKHPDIIKTYPKIYGNAFDKQYELPLLPKSIIEAKALFKPEFFNYNKIYR